MDPGTALAVISLAVQLVGTVQSITEYLRTIRDAPGELLALIETLDQMQSNLSQVRDLIEQQFSDKRLPGSPVFILNALHTCERRIETLGNLIDEVKGSLGTRRLMKRTWASLNVRTKKTRVQELQNQLNDSMSGLHFAVSNNIWQLQLNRVPIISKDVVVTNQIRRSVSTEAFKQQSTILDIHENQERTLGFGLLDPVLPMSTRLVNTIWYHGFFGSVEMREKLITFRSSSSPPIRKQLRTEKVVAIRVWLMKRQMEIYFGTSLASIPRALRVYQIVKTDLSLVEMCYEGDLEGIQAAFANGSISPYAADEDGWSLLTIAAFYCQPELCSFLLRLGFDPDRVSSPYYQKPLSYVPNYYHYDSFDSTRRAVDTSRILAQAQQEISRTDVSQFFKYYEGPTDVVDLMLSQYAVQYEILSIEREEVIYHPLGTALREYGRREEIAGWELLIRKLIRTGIDVHVPIPRAEGFDSRDHPCALNPYGTPLDELFAYTYTLWEAKAAADAWLLILSSEGYDILDYLENEKVLHATQPPITCPHFCWERKPMQLVFDLGEAPSVYAEPWIDPESSTFLIRQELKDTNILNNFFYHFAELQWPIIYPKRYLWDPNLAARTDRRWKKKAAKAARLNGTSDSSAMPGARPGE